MTSNPSVSLLVAALLAALAPASEPAVYGGEATISVAAGPVGDSAARAGGSRWKSPPSAAPQESRRAILLDPDHPAWSERAPATFRARFTTSKGDFVVEVHREWAPLGADRFYNLVRLGFYDDTRFYRIREGEFVQFGLSGDPAVNAVWYERTIADDPPSRQHVRGRVFFAMRGPDDRTTQAVINLTDHPEYYEQGFVPFGEVVDGMDVVDSLYAGYGESAGGGMRGGNQGRIVGEGNAHLDADFPLLDEIVRAEIESQGAWESTVGSTRRPPGSLTAARGFE